MQNEIQEVKQEEDKMAKPEQEIQNVDHIPWQPVAREGVSGAGAYEKILSVDPETGNCTRLVRVDAGVETAETLGHDFWEEIYVIEGKYIDKGKNITLAKGMYGCQPPGMKHGPFKFLERSLMLSIRYRSP